MPRPDLAMKSPLWHIADYFSRRRMSAFGGKVDVFSRSPTCPLMTHSKHNCSLGSKPSEVIDFRMIIVTRGVAGGNPWLAATLGEEISRR
jgi:hypothetical protein